jgi:hypothetical protein
VGVLAIALNSARNVESETRSPDTETAEVEVVQP